MFGLLLAVAALVWLFWPASAPEVAAPSSQGDAEEVGTPQEREPGRPLPTVRNNPQPKRGPEALGVFIRRVDSGVAAAAPLPPAPDAGAARRAEAPHDPSPANETTGIVQAYKGALEGRLRTTRTVPPAAPIRNGADPVCARFGPIAPPAASIDGGFVGNGLVMLLTPGQQFPVPDEPLIIEQRGCQYQPRVAAVIRGQKIQIRNEDGTLHNIHAYASAKTLFNRAQPPGSTPVEAVLDAGVRMATFKCDVHPWMASYVFPTGNPFFAVSDASGHFRIEGVPPGRYTLIYWHELLDFEAAPVEVVEGKTTHLDLLFRFR